MRSLLNLWSYTKYDLMTIDYDKWHNETDNNSMNKYEPIHNEEQLYSILQKPRSQD